jgi:hypothetical protein
MPSTLSICGVSFGKVYVGVLLTVTLCVKQWAKQKGAANMKYTDQNSTFADNFFCNLAAGIAMLP